MNNSISVILGIPFVLLGILCIIKSKRYAQHSLLKSFNLTQEAVNVIKVGWILFGALLIIFAVLIMTSVIK